MGFFSWTCAKTGLPIMAGGTRGQPEDWSRVVVVPERGRTFGGLYDGYGRVDGEEIADAMMGHFPPKLVLQSFYAQENFHEIEGRSENEPGQGFFHNHHFIGYMFDAAEHGEIDTHQYKARLKDLGKLQEAGWRALSAHLCAPGIPSYRVLSACDSAAHWFERAEDAADRARALAQYNQEVRPLLHPSLRDLPPYLMINGATALDDKMSRIAARACIEAWRANVPAADVAWDDALLLTAAPAGAAVSPSRKRVRP